jgi:hypothetical protein
MNRITNKHKRNATGEWGKHPRPEMKRLGSARLRKQPVESDDIKQRHFKRKRSRKFRRANLCPFCLHNIPAQYLGAVYKHYGSCKKCGAVKQGCCSCTHCKSTNVWRSAEHLMCKNCGKNWKSI